MDEQYIPEGQGNGQDSQESLQQDANVLLNRIDSAFRNRHKEVWTDPNIGCPDFIYGDILDFTSRYIKDGYITNSDNSHEDAVDILGMIRLKLGARGNEADMQNKPRDQVFEKLREEIESYFKMIKK